MDRELPKCSCSDASRLAKLVLNQCVNNMEVRCGQLIIYLRLKRLFVVVGTYQLLYRGGGHVHHLCTRPQTQDEDMGPYDRALRERREDP